MLQFRCKLSAWNERAYAHKLTLSTGIVLFTLKNAKSIGVLFCIPIAPLLIWNVVCARTYPIKEALSPRVILRSRRVCAPVDVFVCVYCLLLLFFFSIRTPAAYSHDNFDTLHCVVHIYTDSDNDMHSHFAHLASKGPLRMANNRIW